MRGQRLHVATSMDKFKLRRKISLAALGIVTLTSTNGFTIVPDVDKVNHKNVPTYNNAGLNDARVTSTDIKPVRKLAQGLEDQVPGVRYAIILQRNHALYVGLDTGQQQHNAATVHRVYHWVSVHAPKHHVYVSTDPTLVNHFHRYAADRAAHLTVSNDVILADINREFPGVK